MTITVIIFKLCLGVWLLSDADWRIFNIEFCWFCLFAVTQLFQLS